MTVVILQDFHTPQHNLEESSGYSLQGSLTRDLTTSKVWLLSELSKIQNQFSTIYILGSWYGNMALYMTLIPDVRADKIILVEKNPEFLSVSRDLLQLAGAKNVQYMLTDSNQLDYRQLDASGLVINTSLTDMPGRNWFDRIPAGTTVALQARNHAEGAKFDSPKDIQQKFPLSQVIYTGSKQLQDPETRYKRFMVIGIK